MIKLTSEGIRLLRYNHGLSKAAFARKVGVSRPLINMMEAKKRGVSKRTQTKIMNAFNLSDEDVRKIEEHAKELRELRGEEIG